MDTGCYTQVQLAKQELQAQRLDVNHADIREKYQLGQRRKDKTEYSMIFKSNQTVFAGIDSECTGNRRVE